MGSTSYLTRNPPLAVAPVPPVVVVVAAAAALDAAITQPQAPVVAVKGGGAGLHHRPLHQVSGPPLIPGPAHTLAVTGGHHVVAVKTTPGIVVGGTTAHRPEATGPPVIPIPVHPPRTDTPTAVGPAPGHQAIGAGVGACGL